MPVIFDRTGPGTQGSFVGDADNIFARTPRHLGGDLDLFDACRAWAEENDTDTVPDEVVAALQSDLEMAANRPERPGSPFDSCCPECPDGPAPFVNAGRLHIGYCSEHRVSWVIGSNLFSGWREEAEAEQRAAYDALDLGSFRRLS